MNSLLEPPVNYSQIQTWIDEATEKYGPCKHDFSIPCDVDEGIEFVVATCRKCHEKKLYTNPNWTIAKNNYRRPPKLYSAY